LCWPAEEERNLSSKARSWNRGSCEPFFMPRFDPERCLPAEETGHDGSIGEIEREAFERGFAQGERAGFDMGERKATVLLEKVEEMIHDLALLGQGITREVEGQAVELAVALARKIILQELSCDPGILVEMTKEALTRLEKTGQVTIRIHPAVQELFMKRRPEFLGLHPEIVFSADTSASPLGSIVTGPSEDVSTDIDEQLAVIEAEMKESGACD